MKIVYVRLLFFIIFCCIGLSLHAQYIVKGIVKDSLTNEPLSYTSVYLKGTTEGCLTNNDGTFFFKTARAKAELVVSSVGYKSYNRIIHTSSNSRYTITLLPVEYTLNEIVVKPKREHYKKKNNPAVELIRQMIAHRDDYSPKELDYWQRDRYEITT